MLHCCRTDVYILRWKQFSMILRIIRQLINFINYNYCIRSCLLPLGELFISHWTRRCTQKIVLIKSPTRKMFWPDTSCRNVTGGRREIFTFYINKTWVREQKYLSRWESAKVFIHYNKHYSFRDFLKGLWSYSGPP